MFLRKPTKKFKCQKDKNKKEQQQQQQQRELYCNMRFTMWCRVLGLCPEMYPISFSQGSANS
jgi:hypothetical protein